MFWSSDPSESRRQFLYKTYGIQVVEDNEVVVQQSSVVLLAVKPQILPKVVDQLKDTISTARPLLLSILAGITLHQLAESFVGWSIIRAMPNTPATVGVGRHRSGSQGRRDPAANRPGATKFLPA